MKSLRLTKPKFFREGGLLLHAHFSLTALRVSFKCA